MQKYALNMHELADSRHTPAGLGTVVASRELELTLQSGDVERVLVQIGAPVLNDGVFGCPFEIKSASIDVLLASYGVDSMQALIHTTQIISTYLEHIERSHKGVFTLYGDAELGFPPAQAPRKRMSDGYAGEFADYAMLSSPQNGRVKDYVELRKDGNVRRERKCFLLEGQRAVSAALDQKKTRIREVIFSDHMLGGNTALVHKAIGLGLPMVRVSGDVFKKIADVVEPQGIAAVVEMPDWSDVAFPGRGLWVASCGVGDPGNLGTLIRSCAAAGAAGLITLEGGADPFNAKVVRATAASLLTLPVIKMKAAAFFESAAKPGVQLVAAVARAGTAYNRFDWSPRPLIICVGSEGDGLPPEIERACTSRVTIPVRPDVESLNAAVAASILVFQAAQAGV